MVKNLDLIKSSHGHEKVYAKFPKDQSQTPVKFINEKRKIVDPSKFLKIPLLGKIEMRISRIYNGSCLSLICEVKEVAFLKDLKKKKNLMS